jgi:surfeit locus 1 family protein
MSPTARRSLIVFLLLGAAVCVRLGVWQLDRLKDRRAANRVAEDARGAPRVRLPGDIGTAGNLAGRRLVARGRYDPGHEIVLRGQTFNGVPGVHLVTPLRLPGMDTAVLVNRGFVPAPDAVSPEIEGLDEEGEQLVEGIAFELSAGRGQPIERGGRISWARLDRGALAERIPYPILPVYLLQAPAAGQPRLPRRLEPPPLDDGPHLNYAVQWFLFGAMAVAFAVIVVARRGDPGPRAPS